HDSLSGVRAVQQQEVAGVTTYGPRHGADRGGRFETMALSRRQERRLRLAVCEVDLGDVVAVSDDDTGQRLDGRTGVVCWHERDLGRGAAIAIRNDDGEGPLLEVELADDLALTVGQCTVRVARNRQGSLVIGDLN